MEMPSTTGAGQGRRQPGTRKPASGESGTAYPGTVEPATAGRETSVSGTVGSGSLPPGEAGTGSGLLKAMSPGVVDYLFRQLVSGKPAEDVQWEREGISLAAQPAGAELARRLAETDIEALTPTELFHYVRAAQRLASWADDLRQAAVGRYCHTGAGAPRPGARPI